MNPALWGTLAACAWGTADFAARFTGRALGHASALLGVLLTGAVALSAWIAWRAPPLVWQWEGAWLLLIAGVSIMIATLLLYQGLARGPISVVAPIASSYPALVVALAVLRGARPAAIDWVAIAVVMAGVVIVARAAESFEEVRGRGASGTTVAIALGAAVGFAAAVSAGQEATPIYGELQTVWLSRLIALAALLPLFLLPAYELMLPPRWWPLLAAQGLLDGGAYLMVVTAAHQPGAEIAAVTASGFGAVTVLLARVFLREPMGWRHWAGIAMIFAGVAVLSARG